jgi:uncharacterized protein (DUF3820 family)
LLPYDRADLIDALQMKMPFGKYKGIQLIDLPCAYIEWFARKGFPTGRLGERLQTIHEIKMNGLENIVKPLITKG